MKPKDLILRCYAQKNGEQWGAFCLDFTLAAQGDTFEDAKSKLEEMIEDYLYDALVGEDREHAVDFLSRRAPVSEWIKYYCIAFVSKFRHTKNNMYQLINEVQSLIPQKRKLKKA